MERAFISSQRDLLAQRMRTLCGMFVLMTGFTLFFNVVVKKEHMRKTFSSDLGFETTRVSSFILIGIGACLVLCGALLHPKLVAKSSPVLIEIVCVGVMCLTMIAVVLRTPDYVARILGVSMEEAFGDKYFSDSHVLLMIDGIITAAHLGFPVRWVSMLPLEVTGVLLYAVVAFVIGGNEPLGNSVFSLSILAILVAASALGKRAAEVRERQHFMDIIRERSLRCEAQFELSQTATQETQERQRPQDMRSNAESSPSTTPGSLAFNQLYNEDTNLTEQLTKVSELGDTEHWRINTEEVKLLLGEVLGRGGFGQVVKGIFCGVMVAVKLPHDKLKASDLRNLPALCNELRVLRHVRHPNIVGIHGAMCSPLERKIALVIEFIRGIVLDQFLASGPDKGQGSQPGVMARYSLMLGVCNALLYLHTRFPHIVHGDIKGSNTMVQLLNGAVHAKVLDFGMSRVLTRHAQPLGGTLAYVAPEVVLRDEAAKCSADVYSFGRLITFVATSMPPLSDMTSKDIMKALKQRMPPLPVWPDGCAFEPGCRALVQDCIQADEGGRPSAPEVHRALQGLLPELGLTGEERQLLEEVHALPEQPAEPPAGAKTRLPPLVEEPGHPAHQLSVSFLLPEEEAPPDAGKARVPL